MSGDDDDDDHVLAFTQRNSVWEATTNIKVIMAAWHFRSELEIEFIGYLSVSVFFVSLLWDEFVNICFGVKATNRIDILDDALLRPGRIDRKVEFPNPNEEARGEAYGRCGGGREIRDIMDQHGY